MGTKADQGKTRYDLLPAIALEKAARVTTFGAEKYGPNNWRTGMFWTRLLAASLRHIFAYLGGQDKDPESGESHLAHAAVSLMFLLEFEETKREYDDRYKPKT